MGGNKYRNKSDFANLALVHFFHYHNFTFDSFTHIVDDSEPISDSKIQQFFDEINDIIVASVIADSSDEELIFLHDRFLEHKSFVALGLKLHIHSNGLQRWRNKFLNEISALLNFNLPVEDIFSRNKIEVLVFVLKHIVRFYEHYHFEATIFLNDIKRKLHLYSNLLTIIYYFLDSDSNKTNVNIIKTRILFPRIPLNDLQLITGRSHTTVYHHLHYFQDLFTQKII